MAPVKTDAILRCGKENAGPDTATLERQHADFEAEHARLKSLSKSDGAHSEDYLQFWCEYVKWSAEAYGAKMESKLLARAVDALSSVAMSPCIRDDSRHLRLWVRYAATVHQPQEIFEQLEAKGIGRSHALLYEAWASTLERRHAFAEAMNVYDLGVERGAAPIERLEERRDSFRQRQTRRASRVVSAATAAKAKQKTHSEHVSVEELRGERMISATGAPQLSLSAVAGESACFPRTASTTAAVNHLSDASEPSIAEFPHSVAAVSQNVASMMPKPGVARATDPAAGGLHGTRMAPVPASGKRRSQSLRRTFSAEMTLTQEITTSCVRLLVGEGGSSPRPSVSSSVFEEPTCTMEVAKREVLELLEGPVTSRRGLSAASAWSLDRPTAMQDNGGINASEGRASLQIFEEPDLGVLTRPTSLQDDGDVNASEARASFEVFEESDLDVVTSCGNFHRSLGGRSSAVSVWDDSAINAALDQ
jgi:hypothetical protein